MANELRISLDTSVESHRILKCKQNDDRPLVATIFDNGVAYDLTNCNLLLRCKKPNGVFVTQKSPFLVTYHIIRITMAKNIVDVAGMAELEVNITDYDTLKSVSTHTFYLDIKPVLVG
ncbi:MAG TPA: hypothetical protein VFC79_13000 [Tissierellaceae bacterium]|nr:hypothetical protein [Tissierellaceae bacterium]